MSRAPASRAERKLEVTKVVGSALVYGAYKRPLVTDEQQAGEAARFEADADSIEAMAVVAWEDEGGGTSR